MITWLRGWRRKTKARGKVEEDGRGLRDDERTVTQDRRGTDGGVGSTAADGSGRVGIDSGIEVEDEVDGVVGRGLGDVTVGRTGFLEEEADELTAAGD